MTLLQRQHQFIDYLLTDRDALATDKFAALAILGAIVDDGKLGVARRLYIYHHAYRARLVEVMQDVFERTWAYLGDDEFARAANGYIESAASENRTLNRYGDKFVGWLSVHYSTDSEIAEVANIDWLMRVTFDGQDQRPIMASALAGLAPNDWASVRFTIHNTVDMALFNFNAASIWDALDCGDAPPTAHLLETPTWIVFWRKEFRPHFASVSAAECVALRAIKSGSTFANTCDIVAANYPDVDVVQAMGGWLRRWLADEIIVGFHLASEC